MGTVRRAAARGFEKPVGFQLYTLRNVLSADPASKFRSLYAAGYREVEVLRNGLDRMGPMLRAAGFNLVSGHFDTPLVTGNWDAWSRWPTYVKPPDGYDWAAAVAQARGLKLRYMVIPFLVPGERGGEDDYRRIAVQLNRAGEACRAAGMQLCYHHHAFEFAPVGRSTALDLLMQNCDRRLVQLEIDVFWASVAGVDPVELLARYSGRVALIHLKDKAEGTAQGFVEQKVPASAFKEIGNGVLDIAGILRQAAKSGVKHYLVEQDQCPADPVASLESSCRSLRKILL